MTKGLRELLINGSSFFVEMQNVESKFKVLKS